VAELAVLTARGQNGSMRSYRAGGHGLRSGRQHVLDDGGTRLRRCRAATAPAGPWRWAEPGRGEQSAGVGLFAIEMFVTEAGDILVNESVAAGAQLRVTSRMEACRDVAVFEQHLRAVDRIACWATVEPRPARRS
jgi:5-(carboxyamino)imidazole ribonucleotide synthase